MVFSTSRAVIAFPQSSEAVRIADSAEDRSAADSRLGSFSLRVQEVLNADATNRVNIKNMRRVAISEDSLLDRCTTRVTIRFVQRTNHHNTFRSQGGNHTLFPLSKTGDFTTLRFLFAFYRANEPTVKRLAEESDEVDVALANDSTAPSLSSLGLLAPRHGCGLRCFRSDFLLPLWLPHAPPLYNSLEKVRSVLVWRILALPLSQLYWVQGSIWPKTQTMRRCLVSSLPMTSPSADVFSNPYCKRGQTGRLSARCATEWKPFREQRNCCLILFSW